MKKRFQSMCIVFAIAIGLLLAGCSKRGSSGADTGLNPNGAPGEGRTPALSMQLALGTLNLEGTANAVTSEQAAVLLPLWKATNSLSSADNVTPQELDGLYKQIQKAMTTEQMEVIQSMDLSGKNMTDLMKKLGIEPPMNGMGDLSPEQQATIEAARSSGQRPEGFATGGGPGGGMGPEFGGGPPPGFSGGNQRDQDSQGGQTQRRGGFNTALYEAVIKLLEEKTQ